MDELINLLPPPVEAEDPPETLESQTDVLKNPPGEIISPRVSEVSEREGSRYKIPSTTNGNSALTDAARILAMGAARVADASD